MKLQALQGCHLQLKPAAVAVLRPTLLLLLGAELNVMQPWAPLSLSWLLLLVWMLMLYVA